MRISTLCPSSLVVLFVLSGAGTLSAQVDAPDPAFLDTNGDGIDGDAAKAIFVNRITGDDPNAGTMDAIFRDGLDSEPPQAIR